MVGENSMKILINNIDIVTVSEPLSIENGFILIEDDKITYVGEKQPQTFVDVTIDGKGKLAMPGLVNSHTHCAMTLLRSYADDMHLEKWLYEYIFPAEDKLDDDAIYWGSMLGIAEMIKSGTTTFADMYFFIEETVQAVLETGIRANLSRGCNNFSDEGNIGGPKLQENIEMFKKYDNKGDGRINIFIAPHAVYTCTPKYLKECYEVAKDLGTGIHIHLSETKTEVQNCLEKYGSTPIEHCYNLGILDSKGIGAHCVHPTDREIEIIKETGMNVVHNPGSNLKLASGIAPVPKFMEKGINVCLGTDGACSNNNLNMFEEMNLASLINKGINHDATLVNAYDALQMATINGAKALGLDKVGKIEAGYKADIILLDINKPHFYPKHNIISNLVYSAQGSDVDTVIVNGKILLEKGEFKTIDFEMIKFNVDRICKNIF